MASKLGDVGKLPTSNALGDVGEGQQLTQHTQNIRQHGANIAGQQIYNNPTTPAGQDAQHKWHQNNPTPKMGGLAQQQQNVQNHVDQELVARGAGPGFAHAQARLQGQQPSAPQQSEKAQHGKLNSVMADIKREQATAQANGTTWQPKGVNTVNPSRVDISGDRRRTEAKNGWAPGSMNPGGEHYADNGPRTAQLVKENGPTGVPPAPIAAPTPAPVAQATPAPTGYQWKSKQAEDSYNKSFVPGQYNGTPGSGDPVINAAKTEGIIRPDGSYDFNAARAAGSTASPQQVEDLNTDSQAPVGAKGAKGAQGGGMSPEQHAALAEYQAKDNARRRAEGSTKPDNDYTKLSPIEQKSTYDFLLERGVIPRPGRTPTGQVPNPRNPNKDMNDRPMLPKAPGIPQVPVPVDPSKTFDFGKGKQPNPIFPQEKEWNDNKKKGLQTEFDFKNSTENGAEVTRKRAWDAGEYGNTTKFPNNPLDRKTQKAPQQQRLFGAQQVRPSSEDFKGNQPLPKLPPIGGPVGDTSFGGATVAPTPEEKQEKLNQRAREMLARPSDASLEKQAKAHEASLYAKPKPVGPKPSRVPQTPNFKEGMTFQSPIMQQFNTPKPVEGVDKMPTIKKSNPITDTIKAANTPAPVAPQNKIQPVRNVIKRIRGR